MKYILFILLTLDIYADMALVSVKDLQYKQLLEYGDLKMEYIDKIVRCEIFNKNLLLSNSYHAKRYIIKGQPICAKDVEVVEKHKIKFDFGNIEIERSGEFMGETDKYIKVKNPDGTMDKIDKNGL